MEHGASCSRLFKKNEKKEAFSSPDCSCCDAEMCQPNHPRTACSRLAESIHGVQSWLYWEAIARHDGCTSAGGRAEISAWSPSLSQLLEIVESFHLPLRRS